MQCPRCQSPMGPVIWEAGIEVERCSGCGGVWLDRARLEKIQATVERDYTPQLKRIDDVARAYETARQRRGPDVACPRCGKEMVKNEYGMCSQIVIDLCPACAGIWLDRGELEALIERGSPARERIEFHRRRKALEHARQEGKVSGWLLGPLAFLFD